MKKIPCKLFVLCLVILTVVSCRNKGGGSDNSPEGAKIVLSAVTALYAANGANWNDYIKNDGPNDINSSDTSCDGTEIGGYSACVHGGEKRLIELKGRSSCTGLTAADLLGVFNWTCNDSNGHVRFISTGLREGKNLSDLIDFDMPGWKANAISVYDGDKLYGTSPATIWWTNPVVAENDGMSAGQAVSGTIYVVNATDPAATYVIDAGKVALVIKPGVTLTGTGSATAIIHARNGNFFYLEGAVNAVGYTYGVYLSNANFSVMRNISAGNASEGLPIGIYIIQSSNNMVSNVAATSNGYAGVYLSQSSNNTLASISAVNNVNVGVCLALSSNNVLRDVSAAKNEDGIYIASNNNLLLDVSVVNNVYYGLKLDSCSGNILSAVSAVKNGFGGVFLLSASNNRLEKISVTNNSTGVYLYGATNNFLSDVSASHNNGAGVMLTLSSNNNAISAISAANNAGAVYISSSQNNILAGITSVNNYGTGVTLYESSNNILTDLASANNGRGVLLSSSSNNHFTGILKVGNNAEGDCGVYSGTNPGLTSACANDGSSNAILDAGITLASSFVGKVSIDDTANQNDINGTATYPADPSVFDWTNFENIYRGWGRDGSFGDTGSQGRFGCFYGSASDNNQADCETHGGTWNGAGRIWDWSLNSADTTVKEVLSLPSGNNTLTHTWSDSTVTTFLRHAVEIPGDGIGNDNGLCESGETCLYTPNIGAYQGHGKLVSARTFADGTLTGITLMKYETNGY